MVTRRKFITTSAAAATAATTTLADAADSFSVGLIADAQYVDANPGGVRHYRESIGKLNEAVSTLNEAEVDFSIHLGDLIDRHFESFDAILEPLSHLKNPVHHTLGNHDFSVSSDHKPLVVKKMGMEKPYYSFSKGGLRFIFLDGTEISTFSQPRDSTVFAEATEMMEKFKADGRKNASRWNGAIGPQQISWLETELAAAKKAGEKAVLSCHYPILPDNPHNLLNDREMLELVTKHNDTVIAWFNGHNHFGNYELRDGIHFVTVQGMVNTEEHNAYAVMEVTPGAGALVIRGYGRVPDRILKY